MKRLIQSGRWMLRAAAAVLIVALMTMGMPCAQAGEKERTRYEMDVTLTEKKLAVSKVKLDIEMQVDVLNDSGDAWNELCFRDYMESYIEEASFGGALLDSGIEEAKCGDQPLEVHTAAEDKSIVYVKLNEPLQPGERIQIKLKYEADVPSGYGRTNYGSMTGMAKKRTVELSQFYPMLAVWEDGRWIVDEFFADGECFYTQCADYDITLRLPEKYQVIASGDEQAVETQEGVTEWRITAQNMRDAVIIATNEMDMRTGEACGVTVNSWFLQTDERRGEMYLQAALDSIEAFTEAYGPYPYGELDVLDSNLSAGGMEAPGLIRINQMYAAMLANLGEEDGVMAAMLEEEIITVVVHETAHEWFYAVVGNDQYNEAWLDESFASFSETVYWRHVGGDEETIKNEMKMYSSFGAAENDMTVDRSPAQLGGDYIAAVYQRGASFLYQLELAMDEAFYEFMREYYAKYAFKEADTQGFLDTLAPYIEGNEAAQEVLVKYLNGAKEIY